VFIFQNCSLYLNSSLCVCCFMRGSYFYFYIREGDFRLWEAMSTGALVFVDEMHTPLPHPFLDGVHLVVYDNSDKGNFLAKLKFYLDNPADLRRVAYQVTQS